ncbi:MAG: DUF2339 domain-containing protein [Desulfamplus sp.]|nr:DUF2339 domain-containing protein [Desulfamplus sp.]
MRYILWGIAFAIFIGFIPHYSYPRNEIFGFIFGLLFAEIISLRRRILLLEKFQERFSNNNIKEKQIKEEQTQTEQFDTTTQESATQTQKAGIEIEKEDYEQPEQIKTETPIAPEPSNSKEKITDDGATVRISFLKGLFIRIKEFFTTGNVVLKLGIIIIFFGVSFLLKYAAQHNFFPIEFRLICVVVAALAMLITGWSMKNRETYTQEKDTQKKEDKVGTSAISQYGRGEYGLVLQGGGIGILYLTVFAASKLYNLLPNTFSLLIMIMLVALSCALAVMQDAKSLAVSGIIGGFLAPVLMSTGSGSHVMLFSYYTLLNCGILGIAWFKAWRELNLIGFAFTFIISSLWGSEHYKPELFSTTEPFLILFFLFYVAISVLFAHRQPPKLKGFIDGPLVFGLPLVSFGLQSSIVENMEYGLAITALALGLFYITLATILWNRVVEGMRMLTEAFLAMGVAFGSLAIPLALDGKWTSTAWAIEGAAMVWVGVRQNRLLARLFGIILQFGAGIAFLGATDYPYNYNGYYASSNGMVFLNHIYLGCIFISIAGLFSSYYMISQREKLRRWERYFNIPLLLWGLIWWFGAGINEIDSHFSSSNYNEYHIFLIYCAVSCQTMAMVGNRFKWKQLIFAMMGFLPVIFCTLCLEILDLSGSSHLFAKLGSVAWIITFAVQYGILWQLDKNYTLNTESNIESDIQPNSKSDIEPNSDSNIQQPNIESNSGKFSKFVKSIGFTAKLISWWHIKTLWLLIFVVSHEAVWAVEQLFTPNTFHSFDMVFESSSTWSGIFWGIVPAIFILLIIRKGELIKWSPFVNNSSHYFKQGLTIPALFLVCWILWTNFYDGNPSPLPYFPIVNPLELSQIFVLLVIFIWAFRNVEARFKQVITLLLIFIWLNFVTGRFVHFYFDVPFYFDSLTSSVVFQAAISILWGVIALFTTSFAAKTSRRKMWFAGAVLLALLVLKLFTVDLSGIRTIARIVSFLAVGGLMLLIGYLSPLPPKGKKAAIEVK